MTFTKAPPEQIWNPVRLAGGRDTYRRERGRFGRCCAAAARDDGPGLAHLFAGRRAETGQVGHDRLGHVRSHELGSPFLLIATDLTDQHHPCGLGVGLEALRALDLDRAQATATEWRELLVGALKFKESWRSVSSRSRYFSRRPRAGWPR
jgi:hypothetical protein